MNINGDSLDVAGASLAKYISDAGYDPSRIAVEKNGSIVPKAHYNSTVLKDGDRIEIVCFVGGG